MNKEHEDLVRVFFLNQCSKKNFSNIRNEDVLKTSTNEKICTITEGAVLSDRGLQPSVGHQRKGAGLHLSEVCRSWRNVVCSDEASLAEVCRSHYDTNEGGGALYGRVL